MPWIVLVDDHLIERRVHQVAIRVEYSNHAEGEQAPHRGRLQLAGPEQQGLGRRDTRHSVRQASHGHQDVRLESVVVGQPVQAGLVGLVALLQLALFEIRQSKTNLGGNNC